MIRPFTILLTALISSCNSTPKVGKATQSHTQVDTFQRVTFPKNVYLINNGGCVYKDSIVVDSIGNNLYVDSKSNIYFKTYDRSHRSNDLPVLISRIYNGCEGDSSYDLKKNIDLETFREIGYDYYADKKRVFFQTLSLLNYFQNHFTAMTKKEFIIKVQLSSWPTENHLNVSINLMAKTL